MGSSITDELADTSFQSNPYDKILKSSAIQDQFEEAYENRMRLVPKIEKPGKAREPQNPENIVENAIFVTGFDRRRADIEDLYNYFEGKYGKIDDI